MATRRFYLTGLPSRTSPFAPSVPLTGRAVNYGVVQGGGAVIMPADVSGKAGKLAPAASTTAFTVTMNGTTNHQDLFIGTWFLDVP